MDISLLCRLSDNNPLQEEDDYHCVNNTHENLLIELKMLLNSRVRTPDVENIPMISSSIINYGINYSFSNAIDIDSRRKMLETRLKNVIARFEPRLTQVAITCSANNSQTMQFTIQALYLNVPVELGLSWDDAIGKFYFNE